MTLNPNMNKSVQVHLRDTVSAYCCTPVHLMPPIVTLKTKLGWWASPSAFSITNTGRSPLTTPYSYRICMGVFQEPVLSGSGVFRLFNTETENHRLWLYKKWNAWKKNNEEAVIDRAQLSCFGIWNGVKT